MLLCTLTVCICECKEQQGHKETSEGLKVLNPEIDNGTQTAEEQRDPVRERNSY